MTIRMTTVTLGVAVLLAGCGGSTGTPREGVRAKPGSAKAQPAPREDAKDAPVTEEHAPPGVGEDGSIVSAVEWFHGTVEQALAEAKRDQKLVMFDVGAYWCPPCHELDEKTFIDPGVGAYLSKKYVAVHVDAEKDEGPELVERYHVQAYPTILVVEPSGVEKGRIVDFIEPEALLETLGRLEQGDNVLADLARAAEQAPDDLEAAYAYGHALALAAQREQAEVQYGKVLAGDPDNAKGLAAKVAYDRAMFFTFKLDKDNAGAVAAYRELQARYPESKQALRAYRQIGRVLNEMGKPEEAISALDAMIARDPADVGLKSSYGWFCFRQKCNPARGLEVVREGIEQDAGHAGLRYLEAELLHALGDDAAALTAIRKASELEPKKAYYRRQVKRFEDLAKKSG